MKKILFITLGILLMPFTIIAQAEEPPIICELKEDLNFNSPVQVIYLEVDMKNHTVNGIPSTVLGDDIITYETKSESLTIILPSMYIRVIRKGRGPEGSNIRYTGVCYKDKLFSE
jgi:hypothetical protein